MDIFHRGELWGDGAAGAGPLGTSYGDGTWRRVGHNSQILCSVVVAGSSDLDSLEIQIEWRGHDGVAQILDVKGVATPGSGIVEVDPKTLELIGTRDTHSLTLNLPRWTEFRLKAKRTAGSGDSTLLIMGHARPPLPFDADGGEGEGYSIIVDPHVLYVRKGYTLPSRDGSITKPFDEIQDAVDLAETLSPSGSNPVLIDAGPGWFLTPVVIHEPGISIRGSIGKYGITLIGPATGVAFTLTNATAASLATYRGSGTYSDLVNQGDAGPQDAQYENLYFLSWDANAFEALGVAGDATGSTTNFCYGNTTFGVTLEDCTSWSQTDHGYYLRNARALSHKRCNDAVSAGDGINAVNCGVAGLSYSVFGSPVVYTYDATDPNGRAHGSQVGLYIRISDVHASVAVSAEGKSYMNQSRVRGFSASGSGAHKIYVSHVESTMDLDDTVDVEFFNGFVEDTLTAEADVTFQFSDVQCHGDVTLAAGAGACSMVGGGYAGTLTDPSSRLTYTPLKHMDEYLYLPGRAGGQEILGDVSIEEYIRHVGDSDTYMRFRDDRISFGVGGVITMLDLVEAAQDVARFNPNAANIDFEVYGDTALALKVDATDDSTHIYGYAYFASRIVHEGDLNTYIEFNIDQIDFACGGTSFMRWDEAAQNQITLNTNVNDIDIIVNGGTGKVIETDATIDGVGFFASTPIAQPSSTGETVGFTAGTGTGVNDDSTFTGNVGSTAYRISDIVKHLKNLGLIAA